MTSSETEETLLSKRKHSGTSTSSFGSPGRASHDASSFYKSRLYNGKRDNKTNTDRIDTPIPQENLDRIFNKSSEAMSELPDHSVHLMVTSPPYNVGKEYDEDLSLEEYIDLLQRVFRETYRVLVTGGRACINIANLGRKPYIPLHAYVIEIMINIGYLMRGEIIWNKASSASSSTAWGSWLSASNPVLRDVHEYILVFSKESFSRPSEKQLSTIEKEDFLAWTKSVWTFPAISAQQVGHPAPFPLELPRRCIEMYTYRGDVVVDPFCGSGTTCIAAMVSDRHYVGYEINAAYVELAEKRLCEAREEAG